MDHSDTSPIIAVFRDHASAYAALRDLRSSGIAGESIGVAFSDSTVLSAANNPATYRATGQSKGGGEFEDRAFRDSFRPAYVRDLPGMPNTVMYDGNFEAKQHQHPQHQVMVSVQPEAGQRIGIRNLLSRCGAGS
jgi:hypothetical protein